MDKNKLRLEISIIPIFLSLVLFAIFKNFESKEAIVFNNIIWVIVSIISYNILTSKTLKSLNKINNSVYKIAEGNLTEKLKINKETVFKKLCLNLNNAILSIRGFINDTTIMTDKVINYCENLNDNGKQIELSVNESCAAINKISSDMTEQTNYVTNAKKLFQEVGEDHLNIVKNAKLIDNTASSMIKSVEDNNKIYDELIAKMNESASFNSELASKIKALYEKAFKIQNIADTVNAISKSTNLLSVNASIEAAKAQESGSGFAVVANEIRKLAKSSSDQASEIQNIVNDIKDEITDISSSMSREVESINESIQFSKLTKENLDKTYIKSQDTVKSIRSINRDIDSENESITNIQGIVKEIASISQNITASTQEVAASSEEQLTAMESIFKSISNLTDMNKKVKDKIDSFTKDYKITEEMKRNIEKGFDILKEIAKHEGMSTMDHDICTKIMKENIGKYPYFELFGLVQKDGLRKAITLDYDEKEVYTSFSHRPYFKEAIRGKQYASKPYVSVDTNNYIITLAVPVKDKKDEITGVLVADYILG